MKELYEKYLHLNEEIKRLTIEKENCKADIKLKLEMLETNNYEDEKVLVTLSESTRKSYPVNKLKELLTEEQVESTLTETSVSTLRVVLKE